MLERDNFDISCYKFHKSNANILVLWFGYDAFSLGIAFQHYKELQASLIQTIG